MLPFILAGLVLLVGACASGAEGKATSTMSQQNELEKLAGQWRASRAAEDLVRAVERLPRGTGRDRVRALLGEPLTVSALTDGGESWLYVKSDPERGQFESLFLVFTASGGFDRLDRKPIE